MSVKGEDEFASTREVESENRRRNEYKVRYFCSDELFLIVGGKSLEFVLVQCHAGIIARYMRVRRIALCKLNG